MNITFAFLPSYSISISYLIILTQHKDKKISIRSPTMYLSICLIRLFSCHNIGRYKSALSQFDCAQNSQNSTWSFFLQMSPNYMYQFINEKNFSPRAWVLIFFVFVIFKTIRHTLIHLPENVRKWLGVLIIRSTVYKALFQFLFETE